MSWGAIAGAAISVVGGAVASNNSKKKAAPVANGALVDLQDQQAKSISGNLLQQDNIEQLLTRANNYTQGQANSLMNQAIPGYSDFAKALTQRGQEKLANPYDLPPDVTENLNRIAAERGISRGTRGQFNEYSGLRDLGLNMLDYGNQNFQQAIQALTTVTGTAPRVSPMSPMSFYVTPNQNAAVAAGNAQTLQSAANAQTAAQNFNNQNLWDSISKGVGIAAGAATNYFNQPTQTTPTDAGSWGTSGTGVHG